MWPDIKSGRILISNSSFIGILAETLNKLDLCIMSYIDIGSLLIVANILVGSLFKIGVLVSLSLFAKTNLEKITMAKKIFNKKNLLNIFFIKFI